MPSITLFPAVDLAGGRLARGGPVTVGASGGRDATDPVGLACAFAAQGAGWLHVADLDAAFGRPSSNRGELSRIVAAVAPVPVQAAGGVRTRAHVDEFLGLGAARVVVATAALADPGGVERLCAEFGARVVVGLDTRGRRLEPRGGLGRVAGDPLEVLAALERAGCARFVHTEVTRDGSLQGPAVAALEQVLAATTRPVIASGGVATLADLAALVPLVTSGLEGVIVGSALLAGRFSVAEAIAVLDRGDAGAGPAAAGPAAAAAADVPPLADGP